MRHSEDQERFHLDNGRLELHLNKHLQCSMPCASQRLRATLGLCRLLLLDSEAAIESAAIRSVMLGLVWQIMYSRRGLGSSQPSQLTFVHIVVKWP